MIDENNRNAWEEMKEYTLEELKEFFKTDDKAIYNFMIIKAIWMCITKQMAERQGIL